MDVMWFKQQQKSKRVSSEQIAAKLGLAQSNVSHIYAGRQQMSLKWAQAFAEALEIPIDEILRRAGTATKPEITTKDLKDLRRGFSEGDATPYISPPAEADKEQSIAKHFGARPGIDVWSVEADCMKLGGYLKGDKILVDTHQSEQCRAGDIVIAQVYNMQAGSAKTVLRRLEPPVLVADSANNTERGVIVVDGVNTVIKGKVTAQWRF